MYARFGTFCTKCDEMQVVWYELTGEFLRISLFLFNFAGGNNSS